MEGKAMNIEQTEHLRNELVQVAAVAVAMVEDILWDTTGTELGTETVLLAVRHEREHQEGKWGAQHHSVMEWLSILGEEYGEACQAANETHDWVIAQKRETTP